jgi:hypothetical protein
MPEPKNSPSTDTPGLRAVAAERARQIAKGYTPEHDWEHGPTVLMEAADAVLHNDGSRWPFRDGWKSRPRRRDRAVVAAALLCAAFDQVVGP